MHEPPSYQPYSWYVENKVVPRNLQGPKRISKPNYIKRDERINRTNRRPLPDN